MVLVKNILATANLSISKDSTISDAIKFLNSSTEEAVVIVDEYTYEPICIFTERDLIKIIKNKIDLDTPVINISKKNIITINHNRTIEYALSVLIDNGIRRVVAVDDDNKFLGIVSQKHIITHLEEESFTTNLLVSNIISQKSELVTLNIKQSINDAISSMADNDISSVVILDEFNNAVDIFTEKKVIDITNQNISLDTSLKDVCSFDLISVNSDDSLKDVVEMMSLNDNSIVIVLDKEKKPLSVLTTRDIAYNIKGNYNKFLENRLKGVKNTLNYIGELIIEVCNDNNAQIIQWINEASINRFSSHIIDKPVKTLLGDDIWNEVYSYIKENGQCTKKKIQIEEYFYEMLCSYHIIGKKETILLILRDITDYENRVNCEVQKRQEQEKELKLLQNVINQQSSIIIVTDGSKIYMVNKTFLDFYDVKDKEEFENKYLCICHTFVSHPAFFYLEDKSKNWIEEIGKLQEKDRVVSIINLKTVEPKAFSIQVNQLLPNSNRYVVTLTDITDIKLESQQHYYHATHDVLTKIYNRAFFLDKLNDEITYSSRYKAPFSFVIFDIDHFKRFNDTYGHLKGDEVLINVADVVQKNIRKTDVFARWGGEEFVILLPNTTIEKAEILAQNLRSLIEDIKLDGIGTITASFGISEYTHLDEEKTLIQRADEALYKAKKEGRNKVVSYTK
ncbi:GGDEF domain-containing protein [Arcobacter sp. FWKO B]|uniref:GGDEF domain-containing protein n=1 Tax=Arcobacter sp. FWKO B TaxID=2593672 RepID=UPI0018A6660F|nr:GGDEF domain-containing protein [Arcobacter sp. FWKO B]QOG11839.1 diguanylate cyclase [Arcobacter sp. FWKO B]